MRTQPPLVQKYARLALAGIMFFTGGVGLVAPSLLVRGLGVNPKTTPAILYVFRMFGIRTVLIALDLVRGGPARERALRAAPLVHATDTTAAALAGLAGLNKRSAIKIVTISAVNTILALLARTKNE